MINEMTPQGYPLHAYLADDPSPWIVIGWTVSAGVAVPVLGPTGEHHEPTAYVGPLRYALPGTSEPAKARGVRPPQLSGPANSQQA